MELRQYGTFVMYNGVKKSCQISNKSAEFLLSSLHALVGKENSTNFIILGTKDFLASATESEVAEKTKVALEIIQQGQIANDWVQAHERHSYSKTLIGLHQKAPKLSSILKYKALEISKSLIFKHLLNND